MRIVQMVLISGLVALFCLTACNRDKEPQSQTNEDHMILSTLDKAESFYGMHPNFQKVFEFLRQPGLADMEPGTYELDGRQVFVMLQKGQGKKQEEAKLEAHRKYIDIQYVIAGDETMGWSPTAENKEIAQEYDAEKDIMFFNDPPKEWHKVPPGSFTIFFPKDSHAPMVGDGEIFKAVAKVAVQ